MIISIWERGKWSGYIIFVKSDLNVIHTLYIFWIVFVFFVGFVTVSGICYFHFDHRVAGSVMLCIAGIGSLHFIDGFIKRVKVHLPAFELRAGVYFPFFSICGICSIY
ncbi:hypothetical protein TU75_11145 [Pseudomonas poae]|nr:hypothetical protein TU75_11145 [Pseudomonas poae]